jgi:hypothetical protein
LAFPMLHQPEPWLAHFHWPRFLFLISWLVKHLHILCTGCILQKRNCNVVCSKSHLSCILFPECSFIIQKDPLRYTFGDTFSWKSSSTPHQIHLSIHPPINPLIYLFRECFLST